MTDINCAGNNNNMQQLYSFPTDVETLYLARFFLGYSTICCIYSFFITYSLFLLKKSILLKSKKKKKMLELPEIYSKKIFKQLLLKFPKRYTFLEIRLRKTHFLKVLPLYDLQKHRVNAKLRNKKALIAVKTEY